MGKFNIFPLVQQFDPPKIVSHRSNQRGYKLSQISLAKTQIFSPTKVNLIFNAKKKGSAAQFNL